MEKYFPEREILDGFPAKLSGFIHKRHPENTAKRVARDISLATGTSVPVSTVYKWTSGEKFPSLARLEDLLATYPALAAELYGDLVDAAREKQAERLKAQIKAAARALGDLDCQRGG